MTVSKSINRTRQAVVGVSYDFDFRVDSESELLVYLISTVAGEEVATVQALTTNYTVTLDTVNEAGSISFQESDGLGGYDPSTPDADEVLIVRNKPYTQAADIPVRGGFNETVIELALDNLAIQIQQVKDLIDYSVEDSPLAVASASASASAAAVSAGVAAAAQVAAEEAQVAAEAAQAAAEAVGAQAIVDVMDVSTGHDHDGVNSKTIPVASLGTGTPSATTFLRGDRSWATAAKQSISGTFVATTNDAYYVSLTGVSLATTSSDITKTYFPMAGTLKNFYCNGGSNRTITLYKNGSSTPITLSWTTGQIVKSDVSHEVSIAAGDYVNLLISGGGESFIWAIEFDPS